MYVHVHGSMAQINLIATKTYYPYTTYKVYYLRLKHGAEYKARALFVRTHDHRRQGMISRLDTLDSEELDLENEIRVGGDDTPCSRRSYIVCVCLCVCACVRARESVSQHEPYHRQSRWR
jgi:hypothetical protein